MQRTSSILQGIFTKMPTKINSKALINNMQLFKEMVDGQNAQQSIFIPVSNDKSNWIW